MNGDQSSKWGDGNTTKWVGYEEQWEKGITREKTFKDFISPKNVLPVTFNDPQKEPQKEGSFQNQDINIGDVHLMLESEIKQDVLISNQYFSRLMVSEYLPSFFGIFGIFLSILTYECRTEQDSKSLINTLLFYNLACTVLLVISNFVRYNIYMSWIISNDIAHDHETMWQQEGWTSSLIFETALSLLAPYPGFEDFKYSEYNKDWKTTVQYSVNDILICLCFIRMYHLVRFILLVNKYMNPRSQRVCRMNGCEATQMFAIRSIMRERPYTMIFICFLITIFVLGYQIRVFEGPFSEISGQDYMNYGNAIWNIIITIMTVGYGDFYPKSQFGRVVATLGCFWGVFMVSVFVVTLNNLLNFTVYEENSYELLKRLEAKEKIKKRAVLALENAYRYSRARVKEPHNVQGKREKFNQSLKRFKREIGNMKRQIEPENDNEVIHRLIENLSGEVIDIKVKIDKLASFFEQHQIVMGETQKA